MGYLITVMILSFRTVRSGQTVQTQIRLLLGQGLHCLKCQLHLLGALLFGKAICSNFRVIIVNFLGVRIFRSFTVLSALRVIRAAIFPVSAVRFLVHNMTKPTK